MKFDEPPADVEWNEWGPPVRVGAPPDITLVELRTR